MAMILNYLKGNFLNSKSNFFTLIEGNCDQTIQTKILLNFSFDFNSNSKDR